MQVSPHDLCGDCVAVKTVCAPRLEPRLIQLREIHYSSGFQAATFSFDSPPGMDVINTEAF